MQHRRTRSAFGFGIEFHASNRQGAGFAEKRGKFDILAREEFRHPEQEFAVFSARFRIRRAKPVLFGKQSRFYGHEVNERLLAIVFGVFAIRREAESAFVMARREGSDDRDVDFLLAFGILGKKYRVGEVSEIPERRFRSLAKSERERTEADQLGRKHVWLRQFEQRPVGRDFFAKRLGVGFVGMAHFRGQIYGHGSRMGGHLAKSGEIIAFVGAVGSDGGEILRRGHVHFGVLRRSACHVPLFASVQAQLGGDFCGMAFVEGEGLVMVDGFVEPSKSVFEVGELFKRGEISKTVRFGVITEGLDRISESGFSVSKHFVRQRRIVFRDDRTDSRKGVFRGRPRDGGAEPESLDGSRGKLTELCHDA